MFFKVTEISEILGLSKVTVYNKLKTFRKDLKPFIKHEKGILMLDNEGLELFKVRLDLNKDLKSDFKQHTENVDNTKVNNDLNLLKSDIVYTVMNDQIEYLKKQIDVKDQQLLNMQILLKQEQERKLFPHENTFTQETRSEDHYKNLDEKISLIQERMNELALTKQENKKGFFKKFMK